MNNDFQMMRRENARLRERIRQMNTTIEELSRLLHAAMEQTEQFERQALFDWQTTQQQTWNQHGL